MREIRQNLKISSWRKIEKKMKKRYKEISEKNSIISLTIFKIISFLTFLYQITQLIFVSPTLFNSPSTK